MSDDSISTARLVKDQVRLKWLNLNARDINLAPANCSGVQITYRGATYVGISLNDCIDKALAGTEAPASAPRDTSFRST